MKAANLSILIRHLLQRDGFLVTVLIPARLNAVWGGLIATSAPAAATRSGTGRSAKIGVEQVGNLAADAARTLLDLEDIQQLVLAICSACSGGLAVVVVRGVVHIGRGRC